jgi:hypothetical protein
VLIECENCGAPLDVKLETRISRCNYCGKSNRVASMRTVAEHTPRGWQPPPVWTPPAHFPAQSVPIQYHRRASPALIVAPIFVLLVTAGAGAALWMTSSQSTVNFQSSPGGVQVAPMVPTAAPLGKVQAWDGRSTLSCGMSETLEIDGKQAKVDGTVISASIGCTVRIKNSTLEGDTVVAAAINAKVEVENSTLRAERVAIDAAQAAQITIDEGSRVISEDVGVQMAQTARLTLKNSTIEAKGIAVDMAMACRLNADGATIRGGEGSIHAATGSEVTLKATTTTGKKQIASDVRVRQK